VTALLSPAQLQRVAAKGRLFEVQTLIGDLAGGTSIPALQDVKKSSGHLRWTLRTLLLVEPELNGVELAKACKWVGHLQALVSTVVA